MNTVTSKDGTKIAFDILGKGKPLIFITGATCFRDFMPVKSDAKTFAKEFKVYNYDRRGRGDSSNTKPYSVDREVEDIEALIDHAGGQANLYGHSSGAVLALEAALRLPGKVNKALIYDPAYVYDDNEKLTYAKLGEHVNDLLSKNENRKAIKAFLTGIGMPKIFIVLLPLFPGWQKMQALAPTLAYDIALTDRPPDLKRLSKVIVPIKVMAGGKSPLGVRRVADTIANSVAGAEYVVLPGQDHIVSAKKLIPYLRTFF